MYNMTEYGHMLADQVRMDPYALALKKVVKPGCVVLDIGTSIGIHALLACKFGARQVYAIEPNDVIDLAQQLALSNGYADRITFIQDFSTNVTLPEPSDVIVSDLRGVLPLFEEHIPSIIDARQRHLASQGILIPKKDRLWLAVIEAPATYKSLLASWDDPYGFDMEPAKQMVLNQWQYDDTDLIRSVDLITQPTNWAVLDYYTIGQPDVNSGDIVQTATRDGLAHGLLIWFDAELFKGIGFSNGPQQKKIAAVYGRGFFPFLEPVSVVTSDVFKVNIQATLNQGGYDWHWQTCVCHQGKKGNIMAEFNQSTIY